MLLSAGRSAEAIGFVRSLAIESRAQGPEGQTNKTHGAHERWGSGRCSVVPDSHRPCFVISSGMLLPVCRYLGVAGDYLPLEVGICSSCWNRMELTTNWELTSEKWYPVNSRQDKNGSRGT